MIDNNVGVSINKKGRPADNIAVELFFLNLKREKLYHEDINNLEEAKSAIDFYMPEYNYYRKHSRFKNATPSEMYLSKY